jgi:ankyrin repeat protein
MARTPLHVAVAKGQLELVDWLAGETAAANEEDENHETPLILALKADRADLAVLLLNKGADPNRALALHVAAALEDPALAELLLDRKASVDAFYEVSGTPLHVAAENDNAAVATLLIARGADVNARGHSGTPLHVAAREGHLAVALVHLSHGADVNARTDRDSPDPLAGTEEETRDGGALRSQEGVE